MAPGLPEIATQYGITNPTVTALTLSIFLVSFGIGVRVISLYPHRLLTRLTIAPCFCTFVGNVWSNLGEHLLTSCKPSFILSFQVLHIGNLTLIGFSLGCAFAPTTGVLIGLRFMCM
jgi:hypothetical protein